MIETDFYSLYPELRDTSVWLVTLNHELFNLINSRYEVEVIAKLAKKHRCILEIGTFLASTSLTFLLNGAKRVFTVDKEVHPNNLLQLPFFEDSYDDTIVFLVGDSTDKKVHAYINSWCLSNDLFDFVFIDGGHDYQTVKNDFHLALSVLDGDGTIVFHDYHPMWNGVVTFLNELDKNTKLYKIKDTSFVIFRRCDNEDFWRNYFSQR